MFEIELHLEFTLYHQKKKKKSIIPNINFRPDSFPYNSDVKKLKREREFQSYVFVATYSSTE